MPLRKSLLTVLCLAMFGASPSVAQEKDPFSELNREQQRTMGQRSPLKYSAKSAVRPLGKSSVTYFSPTVDASGSAVSAKSDAPAAIPMR